MGKDVGGGLFHDGHKSRAAGRRDLLQPPTGAGVLQPAGDIQGVGGTVLPELWGACLLGQRAAPTPKPNVGEHQGSVARHGRTEA